ncbi:MAG: EF-hand domain-containing protein [Deltaproteobacteria bacterium]|nr:EF-hand domain-containing protein [Deltaproteobacteria bacterium]
MKKTFLMTLVLGLVLALASVRPVLATSEKAGDDEVSTQEPSTEQMHPGKSWKHGKRMQATKRVKSHFDYLDTNQDGKITHEEFMAPHERRFKEADTDGDGVLTREEFGSSWAKMRKRIREKRHKGTQ